MAELERQFLACKADVFQAMRHCDLLDPTNEACDSSESLNV